jgi:excinuclease UvrABC nuclease subunit
MGIYKPGRPIKYNPTTGRGTTPEHRAGEYRIRGDGGTISYVGETNDLNRRMHQHQQSGKLDTTNGSTFEYKYADGRSTSQTRRVHERAKIEQHNPPLNHSRGGEGRIAKH